MIALLSLVVAIAASVWGYSGVEFDIGYVDTGSQYRLAYAAPNPLGTCMIRFSEGLQYYEEEYANEGIEGVDIDFLVMIAVHEFGHCQGVLHLDDCKSIMNAVILECDNQKIGYEEQRIMKEIRDSRLTNRVTISSLAVDVPATPNRYERLLR